MRISGNYIFFAVLLFISVSSHAKQYDNENPSDIRKKLLEQRGPGRVKLLLDMACIYSNPVFYQPDSALLYAEKAFEYALRINDSKGCEKATALCANISLQLSLVNKGLKYYQVSRELATSRND